MICAGMVPRTCEAGNSVDCEGITPARSDPLERPVPRGRNDANGRDFVSRRGDKDEMVAPCRRFVGSRIAGFGPDERAGNGDAADSDAEYADGFWTPTRRSGL